MSAMPAGQKILHITHIENLPSIIRDGKLWSDAAILARGEPGTKIGMSGIKQRRLSLPVRCPPWGRVGEYVPFYFCPRSIMLFLIYKANHNDLTYTGGQNPIVHLEADLQATIEWAEREDRGWAFSFSNAGATYANFSNEPSRLSEIDWPAVASRDFKLPEVKESKQAEFLMHGSFPWELVGRVGVYSRDVAQRVDAAFGDTPHRPILEIRRDWYF